MEGTEETSSVCIPIERCEKSMFERNVTELQTINEQSEYGCAHDGEVFNWLPTRIRIPGSEKIGIITFCSTECALGYQREFMGANSVISTRTIVDCVKAQRLLFKDGENPIIIPIAAPPRIAHAFWRMGGSLSIDQVREHCASRYYETHDSRSLIHTVLESVCFKELSLPEKCSTKEVEVPMPKPPVRKASAKRPAKNPAKGVPQPSIVLEMKALATTAHVAL